MKGISNFIDNYKGAENLKKYRLPDDDINPKKKEDMDYCVSVMKYLFTLGCNGILVKGGYLSGLLGDSKYSELRSYARGKVDVNKYKSELLGKDNNNNQRKKSYYNISWGQDTGHVKTRDQIIGSYDKMDYEILVSATDPASQKKREKEIAGLKIWQNKTFKTFVGNIGIDIGQGDSDMFESEEDVDLYVKTGGLKLQEEIKMKKAIGVTMSESRWKMLKMMLMNDMVDLGISWTKAYIDYSINVPMLRYVDPNMLLVPCSKYLDFRDITMCAEIREMTIADVRNESELTESQLMQVAKCYGFEQPFASTQHRNFYKDNGFYPYDHIKVTVLDGSWLSSDVKKYKSKIIEKYGSLSYTEKEFDYELRKDDEKKGAKLDVKRTQYEYEGKWIIGTDFAFGYGRADLQIRSGKSGYKKAFLSYIGATTGVISKVERMIPDVDMINLLTFKRRNAIAAIPAPPGLIFNKTPFENTEIDGQIKTPIDLYNMLLEKGILTIDTEDTHGNPISNIHSIVAPIPSVAFDQFRIYTETINEHRRNIQINTGINDLVDGSTNNERMLKMQGEAKIEAANNAMQPEYSMMSDIIERVYTSTMLKWQELARRGKLSVENSPLDEDDIEILELNEDISDIKFGLKIKLGSTLQEQQLLMQNILSLSQFRKTSGGVGGITEDVYLALYRVIKSGNIPKAQLMIAKAVKEQEKLDMIRKQKDVEHASMQNQQAAVVAGEENRKTLSVEFASKSALSYQEFIQDANLEAIKADLKDGVLDNEVQRNMLLKITEGIKDSVGQFNMYGLGVAQPQGGGQNQQSISQ